DSRKQASWPPPHGAARRRARAPADATRPRLHAALSRDRGWRAGAALPLLSDRRAGRRLRRRCAQPTRRATRRAVRLRSARAQWPRSAARADRNAQVALGKAVEDAKPPLRLSEEMAATGDAVFRYARALGLEGIVSKRLGSFYRSGRSRDWITSKSRPR